MQVSTENVGASNLPTVHVYSTYLTKVENSGDSLVKVVNIAQGPKFSAKLIGNGRLVVNDVAVTEMNAAISTGNGTLVVNGKCEHVNFNLWVQESFRLTDSKHRRPLSKPVVQARLACGL